MTEEENKKEKVELKYNCNWCGYKFKRKVGSYGEDKSKVSSQVFCPAYHNFIKTF